MSAQIESKAALRRTAREVRARAQNAAASERACDRLVEVLTPQKGAVIAGYMPIGSEIDPRPAMVALSAAQEMAVPVVVAKDAPLRFDRWAANAPMVEGAFGVQVPQMSEPVVPQVVIVPMLAFDRRGHRLGYGGGFYDRTLAQLRGQGEVLAVGFAYRAQELDDLIVEPWDALLDVIVTEREVLRF